MSAWTDKGIMAHTAQQNFQVPVLLLEQVNLLKVAVEVLAGVVPAVAGIVDVLIL